jgi:CubicO group peptidase (beta-lactamase class C family)
MRRRSLLACLLPLPLVAAALVAGCVTSSGDNQRADTGPPYTDTAQLRAIVEAESAKAGTEAVLFGMWVGQKEIVTFALGNSTPKVPAATDMHYRIGGITETFQTTLLMMLAEQRRIRLDDTIDRWYPNLPFADKVTIRMLAGNTAGYPDYVYSEAFIRDFLADPFRTFTPDELIAYGMADATKGYPPGTSQRYSHTEYVILGQVIERATGESMKSLYERNILGPLGLKDTQFPLGVEIQSPVLHSYTEDRGFYEDATYHDPSWAGATGALTSNLHDLGKWGPVFGTGALVSPESFREMTAPTSVGKGGNRADLYFAYGFVYSNGWLVQNPNMNGYNGGFAYNLATGVTIVVEATKRPQPAIDPAAIHILREVVKYVTPDSPLNF